MYETRTYEESLNSQKKKIYVDCRTPKEYEHSTIIGAVNIPILLNEEREKIGTLYVNAETEEAKKTGIAFVSKRLPDIFEKILNLKKECDELYFFCSRGGYRSTAIVSLLTGLDEKVYKLYGGYKSYRNYIVKSLPELINSVHYITLLGYTGTGKTSVLKNLRKMGYNVLDLEHFANHRGSLLGQVGKTEQNSQKKFEALLFQELEKYKDSYAFIEGESSKIGNVVLPKSLTQKMDSGTKILIDASLKFRVEEIKSVYFPDFAGDTEFMIKSIEKLQRYISSERMKSYKDMIAKGDFDRLLGDLCVKYYDLNYNIPKDGYYKTYLNDCSQDTAEKIAEDFKNFIDNFKSAGSQSVSQQSAD